MGHVFSFVCGIRCVGGVWNPCVSFVCVIKCVGVSESNCLFCVV